MKASLRWPRSHTRAQRPFVRYRRSIGIHFAIDLDGCVAVDGVSQVRVAGGGIMKGRLVWIALVVTAIVAIADRSAAQETISSASISGRVIDPQGAVVPYADIVARQTETNVTVQATTDQEGRFRFPYLRVGTYEITARVQGFREIVRAMTLTVGAAFELTLPLTLDVIDASVTVSADATV